MRVKRIHPLRIYRETHDPPMNQRQAAEHFGVSQAAWSRLERGLVRPNRELTKKLMKETGARLDILMGIAS